jgi:hypothetical protein
MKPLTTWQPDTTRALQIVQRHRDSADYWVRYFYSKSWEQDERQWILVRNILDGILKELGEDYE